PGCLHRRRRALRSSSLGWRNLGSRGSSCWWGNLRWRDLGWSLWGPKAKQRGPGCLLRRRRDLWGCYLGRRSLGRCGREHCLGGSDLGSSPWLGLGFLHFCLWCSPCTSSLGGLLLC
ncbi:unnamed protein product, partial [Heterosigma akashiwo]